MDRTLTILPPDQAGGRDATGLTQHGDGVSFNHSQRSQLLGATDTGSNCNYTITPEGGARISLNIFSAASQFQLIFFLFNLLRQRLGLGTFM